MVKHKGPLDLLVPDRNYVYSTLFFVLKLSHGRPLMI
jgi:hypothetical protein